MLGGRHRLPDQSMRGRNHSDDERQLVLSLWRFGQMLPVGDAFGWISIAPTTPVSVQCNNAPPRMLVQAAMLPIFRAS